MARVLVVDDDPAMRQVLRIRLEKWGHTVETCEDGPSAVARTRAWDPEIVITDLVMPGPSGIDLLRDLKGENPSRAVVLITAHGEVDQAVEAMKAGASDFVTKPLDYTHLQSLLAEIEDRQRYSQEARRLRSQLAGGGDFGPFVGRSPAMKELYRLLADAAPAGTPVLLTGPSGTGKELAARTLHQLSPRAEGPFLPVNSAAIPAELMESELFGHEKGAFTGALTSRPGCFELAHLGTLFLDEIGEMPPRLQAKLLRILEDHKVRRIGSRQEIEVDVRIVAATNRDPVAAVESGDLREDLFFRLNVFAIELPALKDRKGDLPLLVQHFLSQFNERHGTALEGISPDVERLFEGYMWPGNVRELRNVLERAVVLAKEGWIEPIHLPPYLRRSNRRDDAQVVIEAGTPLAEAERRLIRKTLEQVGGNKAEAARRLGVDVKTLRSKLRAAGES
ncbi:MAG: sigma 54-interacting transcriptional regulator [Acidobacteriota bacterium]